MAPPRSTEAPTGGRPVKVAVASYPDSQAKFVWNAKLGLFDVWLNKRAARATEGGTQHAATVVLQYVVQKDSGFGDKYGGRTPLLKTVGSGKGWVLRDGRAYPVTWSRPSATGGTTFTGADGQIIPFKPGQQWVVRKIDELLPLMHDGATRAMLDAMRQFETTARANIHRGVHTLSQRATDVFENARETVKRFVGATQAHELVFTSGTTEALNLVTQGLVHGLDGRTAAIGPGDEIIVSGLEHHANLVPWQQAAKRSGATLRILLPNAHGQLQADDLARGQLPVQALQDGLAPVGQGHALEHQRSDHGASLSPAMARQDCSNSSSVRAWLRPSWQASWTARSSVGRSNSAASSAKASRVPATDPATTMVMPRRRTSRPSASNCENALEMVMGFRARASASSRTEGISVPGGHWPEATRRRTWPMS